jgi:hypothetical protein
MPAFVKRSVGSSCGTTGELGTTAWPQRSRKNSRNAERIAAGVAGRAGAEVDMASMVKGFSKRTGKVGRPRRAQCDAFGESR